MTSRIVGSLTVRRNAVNGATANSAPMLVSFSGLNLPRTQTLAGIDVRRVAFNTAVELTGPGLPAALAVPCASFHGTYSAERGSWRSS